MRGLILVENSIYYVTTYCRTEIDLVSNLTQLNMKFTDQITSSHKISVLTVVLLDETEQENHSFSSV